MRRGLSVAGTARARSIVPGPRSDWLAGLLERRPAMVAAIAQANKTARIVWALLTRGGTYNPTIGHQRAAA